MQNRFKKIRRAAVAGRFYPDNPEELATMIDGYLAQAGTSEGAVEIIIAPHAGYVYSGQVAAYAFKALQGSGFKRIILVGRSHQQYFNGIAADANDAWQTPLGSAAVDKDFIAKLKKLGNQVKIDSQAHQTEHSLEVMLPFLQRVLENDFSIVPLLFGDDNKNAVLNLADALERLFDEKTLLVISSDLSHYPSYEAAKKLDQKTIEAISGLDTAKFNAWAGRAENGEIDEADTLACGAPGIELAMLIAKHSGLKPQLLKYANSGDYFPETKNRAVGYAAIGFERSLTPFQNKGVKLLSGEEQKTALQIARKTLEAYFADEKSAKTEPALIFQEKRGVFVTLKKQGRLRGCIGNFMPDVNLTENIKDMALSAAFNDSRFVPLQKSELKDVKIEISVLSKMQKIDNPDLIEIGKHGVYVRKGQKAGVYLPQVAIELGWTREQFLNSLCAEKAGLAQNCWRDGTAELYIFTAQVFGE
ncbi:MAG: AmmeMemoRadiSam system protein B [Patescibacteria group bacterium]|nr:AmmeMemoRadiSam system protein B [Patescibacteria group bacterium]